MTYFKSIRQCFAKVDRNDKAPGRKRRLGICRTLLILTFAAFQLFARNSAAVPVVLGAGQQTDRFGPHSFPGWIPAGDKVQVFAAVSSSDPAGSPTISVQAVQGGSTLTLNPIPPNNPLYEGFPFDVCYKFIDLDLGLTGSWRMTPTDSTGTGLPIFSDAIIEPEFLPLVEDVTVQGTPLGARVTWTLPNLDGFDVDDVAVRIIDATSGRHLWQSDSLSVQTTSFESPPGVLEVGVNYVYGIILGDLEGLRYENLSWAFSAPFRFTSLTMNGDFNLDGTVDAADYVFWRKNDGTQAGYDAWRTHFGQSAGSGSALPSAESLTAPVPEPATLILMILAAVGWCLRRRRSA